MKGKINLLLIWLLLVGLVWLIGWWVEVWAATTSVTQGTNYIDVDTGAFGVRLNNDTDARGTFSQLNLPASDTQDWSVPASINIPTNAWSFFAGTFQFTYNFSATNFRLQLLEANPTRARVRLFYDWGSEETNAAFAGMKQAIDLTFWGQGELNYYSSWSRASTNAFNFAHWDFNIARPGSNDDERSLDGAAWVDLASTNQSQTPTYDYQLRDNTATDFYLGYVWHSNFNWYSARPIDKKALSIVRQTFEATSVTDTSHQDSILMVFSNSNNQTTFQGQSADFRNPDDLSDLLGSGTSGWFASEENTSSPSDFFNEAEGAYLLIGDPTASNFAQWDLDGATYTRYYPRFKLRSWRKTTEPAGITLEGNSLTDGTDYNLDLMPFSEAWVYDSGGTWTKLADGGDTADADEYLADSSNNFDFDQTSYQIFDASGDYLYLGSTSQFTGVNLDLATAGTGNASLTWEYCSANSDEETACDTWTSLTVTDTDSGAHNLTSSGNFYFSLPSNWTKARVNDGRTLYWLRARLSSGSYSDYPVESTLRPDIILIQYLGTISSDDQTFVVVATSNNPPSAPQTPYCNNDTAQTGQPSPVVGLTDHTPAFSAIFDDPDTSDTALYYQIQVGSDNDWTNGAEMWDSGKTAMTSCNENSRCQDIIYNGLTLSDGQTYYWRIKFWDNSDAEGAWSATQQFTMNQAPTVSNVVLNNGNNINLTENTTTDVSWTATVTDPDGYSEINSVQGKIYRSGVTGAENCSLDDNNCYQDASCVLSNCAGTDCTATCTVAMQFFAEPTDTGSPYAVEYWRAWVEVTDDYSEKGTGFSASGSPDVNTLIALDVTSSLSYGQLVAGGDTGSTNQTMTITNTGNAAIDIELSGDDMCTDYPTCNGYILAVTNQEYALTNFTYGSGTDLTTTPTVVNISISKPTASPSNATGTVYWGIGIPSSKEAGSYSGSNFVTAISDS